MSNNDILFDKKCKKKFKKVEFQAGHEMTIGYNHTHYLNGYKWIDPLLHGYKSVGTSRWLTYLYPSFNYDPSIPV